MYCGVFVCMDKFIVDIVVGWLLCVIFGIVNFDMELVVLFDSINVVNISLVMYGDEMFVLWEGGLVMCVDLDLLCMLGVQIWCDDYKGMLFFVYFKVEFDGMLWNFGVSSVVGLLIVYCMGLDGVFKCVEIFKVLDVVMVYDFVVMQCYLVFLLLLFVYDVECLCVGMVFLDFYVWWLELGMCVFVFDKDDFMCMCWLQLLVGFVFYLGNVWLLLDGQEVYFDYICLDDVMVVIMLLCELMCGQICLLLGVCFM